MCARPAVCTPSPREACEHSWVQTYTHAPPEPPPQDTARSDHAAAFLLTLSPRRRCRQVLNFNWVRRRTFSSSSITHVRAHTHTRSSLGTVKAVGKPYLSDVIMGPGDLICGFKSWSRTRRRGWPPASSFPLRPLCLSLALQGTVLYVCVRVCARLCACVCIRTHTYVHIYKCLFVYLAAGFNKNY